MDETKTISEPAEETLEAKLARLQADVDKLKTERDEALALAEQNAAQRSGPPPRFDQVGVTVPWPPCSVCGQRHQRGRCGMCSTCYRQTGCAYPVQTMDGAGTCAVCGSYPQLPPSRLDLTGPREIGRPRQAYMQNVGGLSFCDSCGRPPGVTFASTDPSATPPCRVCGSSPRPARIGR